MFTYTYAGSREMKMQIEKEDGHMSRVMCIHIWMHINRHYNQDHLRDALSQEPCTKTPTYGIISSLFSRFRLWLVFLWVFRFFTLGLYFYHKSDFGFFLNFWHTGGFIRHFEIFAILGFMGKLVIPGILGVYRFEPWHFGGLSPDNPFS